jgi:hypothetical protein
MAMLTKNWIVIGLAVTAIISYVVGIPPSFSAEYTKTSQYSRSENNCGNGDNTDSTPAPTPVPPPGYEKLVDRTGGSAGAGCTNSQSQVQGEGNGVVIGSPHR